MMIKSTSLLHTTLLLASLFSSFPAAAKEACEPVSTGTTTPAPRQNPKRVERFKQQIDTFPGEADFVLLGDSLARRWMPEWYPAIMRDQKVLNLGLSGDQTQNVIWRLDKLPLKQIQPKAVFIIIGTNNLRHKDDPCDIYVGIRAIVAKVKGAWPSAKILVSEVLPRGKNFRYRDDDRKALNGMIFDGQQEGGYVEVKVDESALTGGADSSAPTYRPDRLHLLGAGYEILGNALTAAMHDH